MPKSLFFFFFSFTQSPENPKLGAYYLSQKDPNSTSCSQSHHLFSNFSATEEKVPLFSLEALHHLHIFIFVLAVVHVVFCASTMFLGGLRIRQWKHWEDEFQKEISKPENLPSSEHLPHHPHLEFVKERAMGFWKKSVVISRIMSFFKQFHSSVSKSDYKALRAGFIMRHCKTHPQFDFHKYMLRALEDDFKKVVGISWYLWLFVVIFLLLDVHGWHFYFWMSFLPLILLLAVGSKLEHIITRLALEIGERPADGHAARVKPSDEHFWFHKPGIVLYLIHFILFQNAFEIAFFFWIWTTYGFHSCILESLGYLIPRLVISLIIQVLCSYSTLPLYAIVTQMGDSFKQSIFANHLLAKFQEWAGDAKRKRPGSTGMRILGRKKKKKEQSPPAAAGSSELELQRMSFESCQNFPDDQQPLEGIIISADEGKELNQIEHA